MICAVQQSHQSNASPVEPLGTEQRGVVFHQKISVAASEGS